MTTIQEKTTRRRGFLASREGLALLETKRQEKSYTYESLAEAAELNGEQQVKNLFNPHWGRKIQKDAIEKIAKVLDLQPIDFIENWLPEPRNVRQKQTVMNATDINWQEVCSGMLEQQQKALRLRQKATEKGFEVKVYVPLGLMERKQQQRRSGNVAIEPVHRLERDAITQTYEHNDFLDRVIEQKPTDSTPHIAIVGEPGAGKTTLLDAIATHIDKKMQDLTICISLASLQGRTVKDYIFQEWLPDAISLIDPDIDVEAAQKRLQKRLRQGGVWLLLDGVDEMGATSPAQALTNTHTQLTDWLSQVRVILTCRTNVWDANTNNPLPGFTTYKTQELKLEQVDEFIQEWFAAAKDVQKGAELQEKLSGQQGDRIRQLVTHPLRLALLCQIFFKDGNAELPETQAGLYEQFVRYFYEWKPTQTAIDWTSQLDLQEELHQALGELAIAGLDGRDKFRLPLSLIQQTMSDTLFKLAWEIGWLNLVDREATTDEPVYAFFHPTFQEYFAALAIQDWHFFLTHDNEDPKPDQGVYRIFEPQWKQVVLVWLGRHNIVSRDKEELVTALVYFEDGCDLFYCYGMQAFFLVSDGCLEFKNSKFNETLSIDEQGGNTLLYQEVHLFKQMSSTLQFCFLSPLMGKGYKTKDAFIINKNKVSKKVICRLQSQISKINDIPSLTLFLNASNSEVTRWFAVKRLVEIASKNDAAITSLIQQLYTKQDEDTNRSLAFILAEAAPGNFAVVKALLDLLRVNSDTITREAAMKSLIISLNDRVLPAVVTTLKESLISDSSLYCYVDSILWYCSQHMSYPDFYRAWHSQASIHHPEVVDTIPVGNSSITQGFNFSQLSEVLRSELARDKILNDTIQLICIDGSQFCDSDNPATDIYIEMVEQGCPESQEGTPSTMPLLKTYWRLELKKVEKRVALLFYQSKSDRSFSESCLRALSTFGGAIAFIGEQSCDNVERICRDRPDLIDAVMKWLRRLILEA